MIFSYILTLEGNYLQKNIKEKKMKNKNRFKILKNLSDCLKPYGNKFTGKESNIQDIRFEFYLILRKLDSVKSKMEDFTEKMVIESNYVYGKRLLNELRKEPHFTSIFTLLDFLLDSWDILEDFWVTDIFVVNLLNAIEENRKF